ncbi:MAG: PSD1 and planctomycete cytochrome C domain-containing protein, partial [Pirellula sp.]
MELTFYGPSIPRSLATQGQIARAAVACLLVAVSVLQGSIFAQSNDFEFFESKVRPILHAHCLRCHHQGKQSGGLALDSRLGWQIGGDSGPAIDLGNPAESLLVRVLRHLEPGLEMPSKAPKFSSAQIEVLIDWIRAGAPDPRESPESIDELSMEPWEDLYKERLGWWAFSPPKIDSNSSLSTTQAIDYWVSKRLQEELIVASPLGDPTTLIRRLSFHLLGLPPDPRIVDHYASQLRDPEKAELAWLKLVDEALDSTEFAEHWARHWMDIVRYAETHGSEDDAYLPMAYRYRDYLIRAFAQDVPIDRLIQEHLAGDLIEPRWNKSLELNESLIGLSFYRFVEFNQTPVDVKREEIAVIDSQIDTIGKAFQGLTISCARCHDHKFDPISDEDYYSLYGILRSTRTAMRCIDRPEVFTANHPELERLQRQLTPLIFKHWYECIEGWQEEIPEAIEWVEQGVLRGEIKAGQKWEEIQDRVDKQHPWQKAIARWTINAKDSSLGKWIEILKSEPDKQRQLVAELGAHRAENQSAWADLPRKAKLLFELNAQELRHWRIVGAGMPEHPIGTSAQDSIASLHWSVMGNKKYPLNRLLEPGYHTNVFSDRASGSLRSPDFVVDDDSISVLCRGSGNARLRLVVENFQGDSLLFDTLNPTLRSDDMQWITMRIRPQWKGLRAHLELLTRDAKPYVGIIKDPSVLDQSDGRSCFGVAMVIGHSQDYRPPAVWSYPDDPQVTLRSGLSGFIKMSHECLGRIIEGKAASQDTRWINILIAEDLLGWDKTLADEAIDLNRRYRELEQRTPVPRWIPGVVEDQLPVDQEMLNRGDSKQPGPLMPRRYLSALGSSSDEVAPNQSGRLVLANRISSPANPLTARVYVNRVWAWLFGEGLVSTVDNFGRMGQEPSHPELLDRLAVDFVEQGWSNKQLIRAILLSETWRRACQATPTASEKDPGNKLWSHMNIRRLEAESIRDSLLWVAGNLKRPDSGLATRNHYLSVLEPNKQSAPGPMDGDSRRSIYLEVRRNFPDEFLTSFDFPKPIATTGKRYTSNSPLQSLMLLNDPFVLQQARIWSQSV